MSLENAKRFIEAASQDQALQERLAATHDPEEVLRLVVEAGSERGLPFTSEEFLATMGTMTQESTQNAQAGELSEGELNHVAGGNPLLLVLGGAASTLAGYVTAVKYPKEVSAVVNTVTAPSSLVKDYLK